MPTLSALPVRVLLVENDPMWAGLLADLFRELGADVLPPVPTAAQALALCAAPATRPGLALLDVRLDGPMNGIELGLCLQECWQLPLLFLTEWDLSAAFEQSRPASPLAFLDKAAPAPYLRRQFVLALDAARRWAAGPDPLARTILLPDAHGLCCVPMDDLLYGTAKGRDWVLTTTTATYEIRQVLWPLLHTLRPIGPLQIHRSTFINPAHLRHVGKNEACVTVGTQKLDVGEHYRPALRQCLQRLR